DSRYRASTNRPLACKRCAGVAGTLGVTNRPITPPSRCAARPRVRGHGRVDSFAGGSRRRIIEAVTSSIGTFGNVIEFGTRRSDKTGRTEFETEAVAYEARDNMQVSVEDLLTGRFSIGQE